MDTLLTIKASHLYPFADTLKMIGAPLDQYLRRAKLPSQVIDEPDAIIAEPALWALVDHAAQREGIDDFGLLCMQSKAALNMIHELRYMLDSCMTLYEALTKFGQVIPQQNSHAAFWLEQRENETWFFRLGLKRYNMTSWIIEQYCLEMMIQLVRISAGKDWLPGKVQLQVETSDKLKDVPMLSDTNTWIGQQYTGISIPNALLSKPFQHDELKNNNTIYTEPASSENNCISDDFIGSLRQILQPYLRDGQPEIALIAEASGNSTRSLQRQLASLGINYSTILLQARFEKATSLLTEQDIKITEIAYEVGYSNLAHFSRAFHSIAGISPRQYRNQFSMSHH